MTALVLTICLLLCSCAPAPCWQQEQELRELLPGTEVALTDIPASVAAEIVRAVRDVKAQYPAAVQSLKEIKTDYAISRKSSFPLQYFAITHTAGFQPYNSILFNDALLQSLGSIRAQYKTAEWLGWHVPVPRDAEMYAITLHELAHCLIANTLMHNDTEIIKLYQLFKLQAAEGLEWASNANLNIWEFLSECFVDAMCNGERAAGVSKAVMERIQQKIGVPHGRQDNS